MDHGFRERRTLLRTSWQVEDGLRTVDYRTCWVVYGFSQDPEIRLRHKFFWRRTVSETDEKRRTAEVQKNNLLEYNFRFLHRIWNITSHKYSSHKAGTQKLVVNKGIFYVSIAGPLTVYIVFCISRVTHGTIKLMVLASTPYDFYLLVTYILSSVRLTYEVVKELVVPQAAMNRISVTSTSGIPFQLAVSYCSNEKK